MTTDPRVLEMLEAAKESVIWLNSWPVSGKTISNKLSAAIASVESGDDWIEIKEGCEMPDEGDCLVIEVGERKIIWTDGEGWFDQGNCVGRAIDMGITHWAKLLPPPSTEAAKGGE